MHVACAKYLFNAYILLGYPVTADIELWTSGSRSSDNKYAWCADDKKLDQSTINWKSGQPSSADGDCVSFQLSKFSANLSTFTMGQCTDQKRFVCEVFSLVKSMLGNILTNLIDFCRNLLQ